MKRIACVGSRETPTPILSWMEEMGARLVQAGYTIVSGNAPGADQAWARGGNSIDPSRVELCLPWEGFEAAAIHGRNHVRVIHPHDERYYMAVRHTHPKFGSLTSAALNLHARNAMIVDDVEMVLGYLNHAKPGGGGTGSPFRIARWYGRAQIFDVSDDDQRRYIEEFFTRHGT